MNELWLYVTTQIKSIIMSYKGKSRRKSNMISFAQVQKHATLNNIIFRDANTIVNNKEKQ